MGEANEDEQNELCGSSICRRADCEFIQVVMAAPNGHGKGVCWWEPAVKGDLEIRGFFDHQGNVLPVVTTFDRFTRR